MSNEQDSWFKSAFDFDIAGAANRVKDAAGAAASGAVQAVQDYAGSKVEAMRSEAKAVADGEHWLADKIDKAQDVAAGAVKSLAGKAKGIPVLEQAASAGATVFDQATQLTAGALEGVVGMGGALVQVAVNPVDAAKGLAGMAAHVPMPLPGMPNPIKAAQGLYDVATGDAKLVDTAAKLLDPIAQRQEDGAYWQTVGGALVDQYKKTVGEDGDYAKGVGRAVVDVGSMFLGVGEASAAAKSAQASKAAEMAKLAEAARMAETANAAKAADVGRLAEAAKAGEVTTTAADAAKVATGAERAKVAQVAERTWDDVLRALDESETGGFTAAGDLIQLGPHGAAGHNRTVLGLSGKEVESAHLAPQSVMKPNVAAYNADHALTFLMEKAGHKGMDAVWKRSFMAMREAGQTTATAQTVFDTVASGMRQAPGLTAGQRESLVAALSDEMFAQRGLRPTDLVDLPYPNIKPKAGPKPSF